MRDVTFWPSTEQRSRLATVYQRRDGKLVAAGNPDSMSGQKYHGGGGGLMATAETYAQFAMMLANGGELNGVRILSPRSVELMGSAFIPSTLPGRPAGEGYGLGVRVVTDAAARDPGCPTAHSAGVGRTARTSGSIQRRTSSESCSRRRRIERSGRTSRMRSCRRSSSNERRLQSLAPSSASSGPAR